MRRSIMTTAVVGLTLALAACGGGSTTSADPGTDTGTPASPTDTGTTQEPTDDPGTVGALTIWTDETRIDAFKALGEKFAETNGVTLDVIQKPTNDIKTDFIAQAPTGEGPDLIVGAHDWIGDFVSNGVISPVTLANPGDFGEAAVKAFAYDGQNYGVPYAIENIALVRNNELTNETPATFDELIEQGKSLGTEFPVLLQQGVDGDAYHLYPLQTSFGAPVFNSDDTGSYTTEIGMGGDAGAEFAAYLKKLADDGILDVAIGGDQAKQAFLDGKSPYIITGPWWTSEFTDAGMDIAVLPVPSAGGQPAQPFVGVQGVYLSSKSENQILANQFLEYVATEEAQTMLYDQAGRLPALTASADKVDDPVLAGFIEAGADGAPMPAIPAMASVWEFWGGTEVSIITGAATDPAAAWATMIENITNAING